MDQLVCVGWAFRPQAPEENSAYARVIGASVAQRTKLREIGLHERCIRQIRNHHKVKSSENLHFYVLYEVHFKMSLSKKIPAIFYRSASGSEPVREWLKTLEKADRQAVGEDIAYVQYKWPIGKPRVDHLRGPIWEVRSKIGNRIARVLFAVEESEMILLHAFVKKTQQTNPADIELATKRLKEWIHGQSN
jgi:phage-related protein